ncbi:MAG: tetraacyldisaccharide 4'-kinase [Nitrospirae bacterium]|nr:tetraacyldisaccharide 4'-kinase [Nitrospirota bacterium]
MNFIECLYYICYSIKKLKDFKNQKKLPYKVISIGNITVGGTGKTPATIAIAEEAKKRGLTPIILTRGYKGKTQGSSLVSKGNGPLMSEIDAGDEAILMAKKLEGVPIIKGEDRYDTGMFAIGHLKSEIFRPESEIIFILDDGFQHWRLFRNKDILLIDSQKPFGNKRLLPGGTLREPVNAVGRADIIVITKTENIREGTEDSVQTPKNRNLIKEIKKYNKKAFIFFAEHRPLRFISTQGDTFPLEWSKGKVFFAFCGIGNPESFKRTLISSNIVLKGFKSYRDHYRYSSRDIENIINQSKKSKADWIVTTEKDIMRLGSLGVIENLIALEIEFSPGIGFYDEVFTI